MKVGIIFMANTAKSRFKTGSPRPRFGGEGSQRGEKHLDLTGTCPSVSVLKPDRPTPCPKVFT